MEIGVQYGLAHYITYLGASIRGANFNNRYSVSGGDPDSYQRVLNDPEVKRKIEQKETFSANNYTSESLYTQLLILQIGYRYQRQNGGFFFRAGINPTIMVWYNSKRPADFYYVGKSLKTIDLITLPYLGLGWSF